MEAKASLIEPLLERVEEYGKISFELLKLKSIDKTADVTSTLASHLLLVMAFLFFALTLNIAIALWLGDLLGKIYLGFFVVALFYGIVGIVLHFIHPSMKAHINNSIIKQILN
jgi:hypothetical protein